MSHRYNIKNETIKYWKKFWEFKEFLILEWESPDLYDKIKKS